VVNNEQKPQAGASVTVRNESTGFNANTLTNSQGEFTFKELPLGGPYTVTVTYSGFGEQSRSGYSLNQGLLYSMPYSEIRKYNVGSKHNSQFPEQQNFPAYIPLLWELIDSSDSYAKENQLPPPFYNIEIKSQPKTDGINHPEPGKMVDLVMAICRSRNIRSRMNIQSFDVRPLQIIHRKYPEITLLFLTMNQKTVNDNLKDLGFTPPLYSPYYKTVTKEVVQTCHEKGVKVIPWTINTKAEIDTLADLGVDGIITDYPNLFSLN
jgi:glycerophosphoryl diester phosphodiesterase